MCFGNDIKTKYSCVIMETLPHDCLYIISQYIADDFEDGIVRTSATISLVAKSTLQLSTMLWDRLEPGCHTANSRNWLKKMKEWETFKNNFHSELEKVSTPIERPSVSHRNTLKELSALCENLKVSKSGTKAKLLENIAKAFDVLDAERQQKRDNLVRQYNTKPRQNTCPVSTKYISKINNVRSTQIVASTAKKDYGLNDDDLSKIDCKFVRNPHYSCASPMRLYRRVDIERYLSSKYGGYKAYLAEQKRKALQKQKRQNTQLKNRDEKQKQFNDYLAKNNINHDEVCGYSETANNYYSKYNLDDFLECVNRYNALQEALRQRNCILRHDSKLCKMYIDGDTTYTLYEVADIMEEMQFLFAHTNYEEIRNEIADKLAEEYYEYDRCVCWRDVNAEASEEAKVIAIRQLSDTSLKIPSRLKALL